MSEPATRSQIESHLARMREIVRAPARATVPESFTRKHVETPAGVVTEGHGAQCMCEICCPARAPFLWARSARNSRG